MIASGYHYWFRESASDYSVVFPSATVLLAFASVHLLLIGMVAELVVQVGDYREGESIVIQEGSEEQEP
jgi:hypothetical protein